VIGKGATEVIVYDKASRNATLKFGAALKVLPVEGSGGNFIKWYLEKKFS
jgi:hypothetical protein